MATLIINKDGEVSVKAVKKELADLGLHLDEGYVTGENGYMHVIASVDTEAQLADVMLVTQPEDGRMAFEKTTFGLVKNKWAAPETVEAWFNNFLTHTAAAALALIEEEEEEEEVVVAKPAPKTAAKKKAEPEPEEEEEEDEEDSDGDDDGDDDEDWDDEEEEEEESAADALTALGLKNVVLSKLEEETVDTLYEVAQSNTVSISGKATKAEFVITLQGEKNYTAKAIKTLKGLGEVEVDKEEFTATVTIER